MADIFSQDEVTNVIPENPLEALVGEGKKFSTAAELARAKIEADNFIEQLKRENAEYRKEVQEKITMDEFLTKVRSEVLPKEQNPEGRLPPQNSEPDSKQVDLDKLVQAAIEKREAYNKSQGNTQIVEAEVTRQWGEQAAQKLQQKARELGMSLDKLKDVAQTSPDAFYTLVGLQKTKTAPSITPPASRGAPVAPQGNSGGQAHWDQVKANNRAYYFSQEGRMAQYKDMMANPEAFGITV